MNILQGYGYEEIKEIEDGEKNTEKISLVTMIDVFYDKKDIQNIQLIVDVAKSKEYLSVQNYGIQKIDVLQKNLTLKKDFEECENNIKKYKEIYDRIKVFVHDYPEYSFDKELNQLEWNIEGLEADRALLNEFEEILKKLNYKSLEKVFEKLDELSHKYLKILPTKELTNVIDKAKPILEKLKLLDLKVKKMLDLCKNQDDYRPIADLVDEIEESEYGKLYEEDLKYAKTQSIHYQKKEQVLDELNELLQELTVNDSSKLSSFLYDNRKFISDSDHKRATDYFKQLEKKKVETQKTPKSKANLFIKPLLKKDYSITKSFKDMEKEFEKTTTFTMNQTPMVGTVTPNYDPNQIFPKMCKLNPWNGFNGKTKIEIEFTLTACNRKGDLVQIDVNNLFEIKVLKHPDDYLPIITTNTEGEALGTLTLTFKAEEPYEYSIAIYFEGIEIYGSPFTILIEGEGRNLSKKQNEKNQIDEMKIKKKPIEEKQQNEEIITQPKDRRRRGVILPHQDPPILPIIQPEIIEEKKMEAYQEKKFNEMNQKSSNPDPFTISPLKLGEKIEKTFDKLSPRKVESAKEIKILNQKEPIQNDLNQNEQLNQVIEQVKKESPLPMKDEVKKESSLVIKDEDKKELKEIQLESPKIEEPKILEELLKMDTMDKEIKEEKEPEIIKEINNVTKEIDQQDSSLKIEIQDSNILNVEIEKDIVENKENKVKNQVEEQSKIEFIQEKTIEKQIEKIDIIINQEPKEIIKIEENHKEISQQDPNPIPIEIEKPLIESKSIISNSIEKPKPLITQPIVPSRDSKPIDSSPNIPSRKSKPKEDNQIPDKILKLMEKSREEKSLEEYVNRIVNKRKYESSHELLNIFHQNLLKVIYSNQSTEINRKSAFSKSLVDSIITILNYKKTSKLFWQERTILDIFQGFYVPPVQKALEFFHSKKCKSLLKFNLVAEMTKYQDPNVSWVQFILETGDFVSFIKMLLNSQEYLDYCYLPGSIISGSEYRDDLMVNIDLLSQIKFNLGYTIKSVTKEMIETNAEKDLHQLRVLSKTILNFYLIKKKEKVKLIKVADDFEEKNVIGDLIRTKFIPCLENICSNGIKVKNIEGYWSIWEITEMIAPNTDDFFLKRTCLMLKSFDVTESLKFQCLICLALNHQVLNTTIENIFKKEVLEKFFEKESLWNHKDSVNEILEYLSGISKLPFRMDINKLLKREEYSVENK